MHTGKGRKNRITPLTPTTTAVLEVWLAERTGHPNDPVFPTASGGTLSRDGLDHRITKYIDIAAQRCPTLHEKRVTPHTLRHYVDGWVMWPPGVFPVLTGVLGLVAAT